MTPDNRYMATGLLDMLVSTSTVIYLNFSPQTHITTALKTTGTFPLPLFVLHLMRTIITSGMQMVSDIGLKWRRRDAVLFTNHAVIIFVYL